MRRALALILLIAAAAGAKRLLHKAAQRRRQAEAGERLLTWESEGGAVPLDSNRTAALTEVQAEPPR
jgi:hypothetical protein